MALLGWLGLAQVALGQHVHHTISHRDVPERPTNVVLMIADGTGPATITMARDYVRDVLGQPGLALDGMLVGTVQTRSTDSRVTDSAAGATAFSTGVRTYNNAIAVDTLRRPLGTLLEAAEARGMATGLVATSRITHATPASFAAHVPHRDMENEIAAQMIERGVEVLFGGGRRHFLPETEGGSRKDAHNLVERAQANGYQVVQSTSEFASALQAPVLGLFAHSDMAFDVDRDTLAEPSLAQMAVKALDLLDDDPDGFFLMVEGSRIDHAAHDNDFVAHLHDMIAYDEAVAAVLDFARRDGNTLVVSVSDHETGGLSLGRWIDSPEDYAWRPEVLARIKTSHTPIIAELEARDAPIVEVIRKYTGIDDLSRAEVAAVNGALASEDELHIVLDEIIGQRALIEWATDDHTAVDVNLYAFGPGWQRFVGNHDNTHVGQTIADLLRLDLEAATAAARAGLASK